MPPAGHCLIRSDATGLLYRPSDLRSGSARLYLDWSMGPYTDFFDRGGVFGGVAAGAIRYAPIPRCRADASANKWSGFPEGFWSTDADGAYCNVTANGRVTLPTIAADADMTLTLTLGSHAGAICRYQNGNNYWRVALNASSGNLVVEKVVASTPSTVATVDVDAVAAGVYTLRVVTDGNDWEVFVNGVSRSTFTDSALASDARWGLYANSDTTTRFRSIHVEPTTMTPHNATAYTVRNHNGTIVDAGVVVGTDQHIDIDASIGYGTYYVRLAGPDFGDSDFGTSSGDVILALVPEHAGLFPEMPTQSIDSGDVSWAESVRSLCGMGPVRWELGAGHDTAEALVGATLMDDYWISRDPGGRAARHNIGHIVRGLIDNTEAEITTIVNTLKGVVKVWEGLNEPSGDGGYSSLASIPDYITEQAIPLYETIKAEDPTAIVLGPNLVQMNNSSIGLPWFEEWLIQGGADYVDAISIHVYNCSNGDIWLARSIMRDIKALLVTYGYADMEIWQTEQGQATTFGGALIPRAGARFDVLRRFVQELEGIPIERDSRWYDLEHGFPSVPFQWFDPDGGIAAFGPLCRIHTAETWNKPLVSLLDFGSADDLYAGGYWEDADGDGVIGILAQSPNLPSVRLAISGAASVTRVDEWGNESTLTVAGGRVTVPISDLPVWVRIPGGVTATVVEADWDWGTALQTTATATFSDGSPSLLARVNDGIRQNSYYDGTNEPFSDTAHMQFNYNGTSTLPEALTLTWASPQTANRVVVDSTSVSQTFFSIPLDFTIELEISGVWTEVYAYTAPDPMDKTQDFRSEAWASTTETWWDDSVSVHVIDLDQAYTFTALRYTVNDASFGGHPSQAFSQVMWGADARRSISLRELEVFNVTEAAPVVRTVLLLAAS